MSKKVLVCTCASANIFNIGHYILELYKLYDEVNILPSENCLKFISPAALELFADKVYIESKENLINHIKLSQYHDQIIILPASVNTINKLANGICDNLLLTVCYTSFEKLIVFPNMNKAMWEHPITLESKMKLEDCGIDLFPAQLVKSYELADKSFSENIVTPSPIQMLQYIQKVRKND